MEVGDARIEYDVRGNGDLELLLIPGGIIADAFQPLLTELTHSSNRFRIVSFHRRGYSGSSKATSPFSFEGQAQDCIALMDNLDFETTHVVAHSLSGLTALQLAVDLPQRIGTLALIEPALTAFTPITPQSVQAQSTIFALYQSGNKVGALDTFMQGVSGPGYRETMDKALPAGWFEQALKDFDTFVQIEFPALRSWRFDSARKVKQPVLSIYGTENRFDGRITSGAEYDQLLRTWFPQMESLPIRGASHWPHITNTIEVAKGLTNFLNKNAANAKA
jgi:pimeloyl-ACP methyl ester carboxylesterase